MIKQPWSKLSEGKEHGHKRKSHLVVLTELSTIKNRHTQNSVRLITKCKKLFEGWISPFLIHV